MINYKDAINSWLLTTPENRDFALGAHYFVSVTGDVLTYNSMLRAPDMFRKKLERELRGYIDRLEKDEQIIEEAEKRITAEREPEKSGEEPTDEEVKELIESEEKRQKHFAEIKGGKRPDHESLPIEIQNLWVENGSLRRRIQNLHLELRTEAATEKPDTAKMKKITTNLVKADKKYHDNWAEYDNFARTKGD